MRNHSLRTRISRLGLDLIEGPFSIRPPAEVDDYGWLECDLRLVVRSRTGGSPESVCVYVDDSVNRAEGFLPPVIRHAAWHDMGSDLKRAVAGDLAWPGVTVSVGRFELARAEVDQHIRRLQTYLCTPPFTVMGLVPDRAIPKVASDHERGKLRLYARSGVQSVEFESPALTGDGGLTDAFFEAFASLKRVMQPINLEGWYESYRCDPNHAPGGRALWQWPYKPGRLSAQHSHEGDEGPGIFS